MTLEGYKTLGGKKSICNILRIQHALFFLYLCKSVICGERVHLFLFPELQDAVDEVLPSLLEQQVTVFILADRCRTAGVESFKDKMSQVSSEPLPKDLRSHLTLQSPAVYVYTSGTTGKLCQLFMFRIPQEKGSCFYTSCTFNFSSTGLPKAAVLTHTKLWFMSFLQSSAGVNTKDVVYISLPLYHSAAFIGFTGAIQRGTHTFGFIFDKL